MSEKVCWKKGQMIGHWVILKKCFTDKMKPRISFSYEDSSWIKPVADDIRMEIERYFAENPAYKQKFDKAELKLLPMVSNCWFGLPPEKEADFKAALQKLPECYTMNEFWDVAKEFRQYVANPPTAYLLNLYTYPWDMDEKANYIYFDWELIQN